MFSHAQSILDDELKLFVAIDSGRNGSVIVKPFVQRYVSTLSTKAVVSFKSLNELDHYIVQRSFSLDDIGVSLCIVGCLDVVDVKFTAFPVSEKLVGDLDKVGSFLAHFAADGDQELVVVDGAVSVVVERTEQAWHVFFADAHFEVLAGLEEFDLGETSTIVIIHNLENSLQSDHAPGTSRLQFVLEKSQQIVGRIMSRLLEINLLTLFLLNIRVDASTICDGGDCILFT